MTVGDFFKMMEEEKKPFWLTNECPQCGGQLVFLSDMEDYACQKCTFYTHITMSQSSAKVSFHFD